MNTQPQQPRIKRYLIYCRKSSESDERQVQSLSDQMNSLLPIVEQRGLQIYGEPLQESKSAKSPGRPVFDLMISHIEEGNANGILLLNPSRLSRNTVDTGRIIFLMDQGKLDEVVTPYQTFKNNPYDKFMLNLLCTQAKLENDNKSVVVKDAMHFKAERGDFPGKARPGYINNHSKNQGQRDISKHPVYFPLMRRLVDLALTGNYSVEALCRNAKDLGIRSITGNPIAKSSMHRYLRDPFYIGKFWYKGKLYKGNHPPLMTEEEFLLLRDILDGKPKSKPQKREFALSTLMKCGECHYCITAEIKTKNYVNGTSQLFAYYRCSKKGKVKKCSQAYVSVNSLENQVGLELCSLELDPEFVAWALEALEEVKNKEQQTDVERYKALQTALDGVNKRMNNLLALKISPDNSDGSLLSDVEFSERKQLLLAEKEKIIKQLKSTDPKNTEWAKLGEDSFDFGLLASKYFTESEEPAEKKLLVREIGSDLILLDQKLDIQLRFLFLQYKKGAKETKAANARLGLEKSLSNQANLKNYVKSCIWYPWRDSNPQPTR